MFIKIIVLKDVNVYHDGDSDDHEYDNDDNDEPVHINDFTECGQYLGCVAQYVDAHNRYRDSSHSHLSNIVISGGFVGSFMGESKVVFDMGTGEDDSDNDDTGEILTPMTMTTMTNLPSAKCAMTSAPKRLGSLL